MGSVRFNDARLLIDVQLKEKHDNREVAHLYFLRSYADAALKDIPGLRKDAAEAVRLADDKLWLHRMYFWIGMSVDRDLALSSFEQMAALSPDAARDINEAAFWKLSQYFKEEHRQAEYERLVLALAEVSYGDFQSADEVQAQAAEILLKRGDFAKAIEHARKVAGRDGLKDLLTDRRFEQLWPELERTVGDRLENAAKSRLVRAQAVFKADPGSLVLRRELMRAYRDLGRLNEAEKLGSEVGRTLEDQMALTEVTAYVVDDDATLLAMLGRSQEADRRRADLLRTWTDDRVWIINMAINRLAQLYSAGHYQDVLNALDEPDNRYQRDSSPYAKQLLRVLRISSLVGLGRQGEAKAFVPDLLAHQSDSPSATIDALLIVGMYSDAEKIALTALADPDRRGPIIESLRIGDHAPKSDDTAAERLHMQLRSRPAVEKAFQAYARDLPERFRITFE